MPNNLTVDLLKQIEEAMMNHGDKYRHNVNMVEAIETIKATNEYTFLQFHTSEIDPEAYIETFIRFMSGYTSDIDKITSLFFVFIDNIRRTSQLFNDPAIQFMSDPSTPNLLMGFFLDKNITGAPIQWH
jgi:hypothetical protein